MKRLLAFPLFALALVWTAAHAGAASSVAAGWWTSSPLPAPDVPSGGLSVQGGPDASNPVAFSALSFALGAGEKATSVRLAVTANSGTTPNAQLMACALTTPLTPASGGAMNQAPKYDCGSKATASPSSDGKTYSFDVSGIPATGALAIAILPTQATDRVVFDAPTTSSLTSTTAPVSTSADSSSLGDSSATSSSLSSGPTSSPSFDVPSTPAPVVPGPASGSLGSETPRASAPAASQTAVGVGTTTGTASKGHTRVLVPLALGLAIVAAALWLLAGAGGDQFAELAEETS